MGSGLLSSVTPAVRRQSRSSRATDQRQKFSPQAWPDTSCCRCVVDTDPAQFSRGGTFSPFLVSYRHESARRKLDVDYPQHAAFYHQCSGRARESGGASASLKRIKHGFVRRQRESNLQVGGIEGQGPERRLELRPRAGTLLTHDPGKFVEQLLFRLARICLNRVVGRDHDNDLICSQARHRQSGLVNFPFDEPNLGFTFDNSAGNGPGVVRG